MRQQDLIQIVRSPYEDKVMRELADDLSAALRSLRGRLMDEEVRRQYFESLLNKVDTAVLVTDREGAIEWKNRAADALLDTRCRLPNEFLEAIKAGKTVVRYGKPSVPQDWAIDATRIDLRGCERWIVSLKNIHSTLERNEMEAWQKLIRVLTHEIMNSLAPITSLSDTLLHLGRRLDADVERGLDTISSTSRRLTAFVETFRRFTRIPEPRKSAFEVRGMLERAVMLAGVSDVVRLDVEPSQMLIYADEGLVEQVAVNLLKNAREAAEGLSDGRIEVVARISADETVRIDFGDNGAAIPAEVSDNIFTPFFTTKPDGSGIGLSVSRRIMQLHGGSLRLTSNVDGKVTFTLFFA